VRSPSRQCPENPNSESQLKDAPRLPDYDSFLEDPEPVIAAWEDYLSAHLIAGLKYIGHENPGDLFALELVSDRRSLQIGEKTQIGLFIRGTPKPAIAEDVLSKSPQPPERSPDFAFSTNIEYEPKTAGIKTIGPFEIDFQGKHLKSNSVMVEVTDNWPPNEEWQEVRIFPRTVTAGTPIRVIYRRQYSTTPPPTGARKDDYPISWRGTSERPCSDSMRSGIETGVAEISLWQETSFPARADGESVPPFQLGMQFNKR